MKKAVLPVATLVFLLSLIGLGPPSPLPSPAESPLVVGANAFEQVGTPTADSDWLGAVQLRLAQDEYRVSPVEAGQAEGVGAQLQAPNRAHGVRTYFTEGGPRLVSRHERNATWSVNLGLESIGRGAAHTVVVEPRIETKGNRVEYLRPGITEWYVNDPRGLEQGFTIDQPPSGEGDLVLRLAASEATPRAVEGGVEFWSASGARVLRFDELHAFARDGRELLSRMTVQGQRVELRVAATEADYPVLIDPMATGPTWTAEGNQAGAYFGYSVASAGDVNRDGYADVIVGAEAFDNGQADEGRAYVYLGGPAGLSQAAAWTAESDQAGAHFGYSVSSAGDVNGDGYADVVVGAYGYDNGQTDEGRAYVYHGGPSGPSLTAAWMAESGQADAQLGNSVASAGDVNRDGFADVIVGAYLHDGGEGDEGRAYLYLGSGSGLSGTAAWSAESNQGAARFGYFVASAGDVNGDGYGDVVVSAPLFDNGQVDEGRAYVYHGGASGLAVTPAWTAESDQADAGFGISVSRAGDVNRDGYGDVVVGAYNYDNGQSNEGRAFVYHGGAIGLAATAAWTSESDQANAHFGNSVASAGDVNGDGYADVVVGAYALERAYVYQGGAIGLATAASWSMQTDQANAYPGWSVASAGDVNGDGYADVIVGAYLYDNGQTDEGRTYVFHGGPNGAAAGAYTNTALDTTGDVGEYTSIAIGADGLALISYRDKTNGDLKVAHCSDVACASATITTLDSAVDVGEYTGIAIGVDGLGLVSYRDKTNFDLKVAHCDNTACTSATISTLDSSGSVGEYTDVAIGTDGLGLISYHDDANDNLKVAHCSNTACTSATTSTIDTDQGTSSSITIGSDGLGLVSYQAFGTTNRPLKVAHCSNVACTSATTSTIDATAFSGDYTSIAVGTDGLGLVAYKSTSNHNLRVAHCSNLTCTSATVTTLDSTTFSGYDASLAIGADGLGIISYRDFSLGLRVAHCSNVTCTSAAVVTLPTTGFSGYYSSIAIGADGIPIISHHDESGGDLRVAHCADPVCGTAGATPSLFQFTSSSYVVAEAGASAILTVQRLNNLTGAATVNYSTSPLTAQPASDYSTTSGTLSFADGEAIKTFNVPIVNNVAAEANETFKVTLSLPTGVATLTSPYTATVTIVDGSTPGPRVSVRDAVVNEGNTGATDAFFKIVLSGPAASPVTVDYATSSGTAAQGSDFAAASGSVTFAPGTTSETVIVPAVGDSFVESNETFNFTLSGPVNATVATGGTSGGMVWNQSVASGSGPGLRTGFGSGSAYDEVNDRLIIFGGVAGGVAQNDVWALTAATSAASAAWIPLTPTGTPPPARYYHSVSYDPAENRLIVHAGANGPTKFNDTWVLKDANGLTGTPEWIQLPSAPVTREGPITAYDPNTRRLIVFGGDETGSGSYRSDVWVLSDATGTGTPAWSQLSPTGTPPSGRCCSSAVYDPGSNRLILFGGQNGSPTFFSDVWILTNANGIGGTAAWIPVALPGGPAGRVFSQPQYDPATKRMVLFGGLLDQSANASNETWILENADATTGSPRWIAATPSGSAPPARGYHVAAYSRLNGRLVLYGGASAQTAYLSDVWVLDNATGQNIGDGAGVGTILNDDLPASTSWSQLSPAGGPGARAQHLMALDTANNRMITFGGLTGSVASGVPTIFNDVWVLTNQDGLGGTPTWTQLSPTGTPPAARAALAGGYDGTNNRLILFGGNRNVGNCNFHSNDTWILTNANGLGGTPAWTQLSPTGTPPSARSLHRAVYDAATNRLIVFGGSGSCNEASAMKNDVWVLTNANGLGGTPAWTQISPSGSPPALRNSTSMTYDPATNRLTLFSGIQVVTAPDVWVLTNANGLGGAPVWTQQSPTGTAPSGRGQNAFVYDGALNQMLVFGGGTPTGHTNEIWSLASANGAATPAWAQLSPSGTPPGVRSEPAAVWNPGSRRMTVFGGIVGTNATADIWVFAESQAVQNGNLAFSSASYSVGEGGGTATITVTRTGGSTGAVSVQYATSNGSATSGAGNDYTATSGTLNWADGDSASKTFNVPILEDSSQESNETVTLTLSNAGGGASLASPAVATLTILDNEQPSVSIGDVSVTEGNAGTINAVFTVSLSFSPVSNAVTMNFATSNGTATTADADYVANSGPLTFNISGATTQQVTVVVNGDTVAESDETFFVTLSALTNATFADSQAQGTILNDDFSASQQWQALRSMSRGHTGHTATLLPNGRLLVAGGDDATGASAELFDPASGTWTLTGSLASPRSGHSATLLPNGKVLVAGGNLAGQTLASSELYDPATGLWSSAGNMTHARVAHTATLLNTGKVLVVGGVEGTTSQRFAELYDPVTGVWTATGSLQIGRDRAYHTATLLQNGMVLIAGGSRVNGATLTTLLICDMFDPSQGANGGFVGGATPAGTLTSGRAETPTATLLTNGKVLLAGGLTTGVVQTSAELYDPGLNTWTATGSMSAGRHQHTASLLPNGNVMLVGGRNGASRLASAEVYNVGTGAWQSGGVLTAGRYAHTASLLPSGKVVVAGGSASTFLTSVEMYDPFTGTWAAQGSIGSDRRRHSATLLPNGEVLIAGGETAGSAVTTAMRFEPNTGVWSSTGPLALARSEHTASLLGDGRVLVVGGQSSGTERSSVEIYSPITGLWSATAPVTVGRYQHTATVVPGGRVLVIGGQKGGNNATETTEIYDRDAASWTNGVSMNRPRYAHTATLLANGNVLVAGGHDDSASIGSALIYELNTGTWRATGSLNVDRMNHTAILLPSGKVLVAGGMSDQNEVRLSAEVYDPSTETWSLVGNLSAGRESHAMALLDDGSVLVAGGGLETGSLVTEVFDGLVGVWRSTGALNSARYGGSLTVLSSGRVLMAGGHAGGSTEIFDLGHLDGRRPVIQTLGGTLTAGSSYTVTGSKFGGGPESSGGGTNASASNYPLLELRSLQDDQVHRLTPGPVVNFAPDPLSLAIPSLPAIDPGFYRATVRRSGVPSVSAIVSALCTISITSHPAAQSAAIGATATFSVTAPGALTYQWFKNALAIPGATGPAYTTPPVTVPDAGALYTVKAIGRCGELLSTAAILNIADATPPELTLLSPTGGEYWLLSTLNETPQTEVVSWSMSDNVRICRVEVSLLASTGGGPYAPVPAGGFQPAAVGPGGVCASPGVTTQSSIYTVPVDPPSGTPGSLYKVQVRVIDLAGNVTVRETPTPFYMVRENADSVKTLIVTNLKRLQSRFGAGTDYTDLLLRLNEFASHPKVQGVLLDVDQLTDLGNPTTGLYKAWDDDPTNPDRANQVLFGCPATTIPGCTSVKTGIQEYVHDLLRDIYTGVRYIVVVGDDNIIPMARLTDRGFLFTESNYTSLQPGSPVASALAANKYLSDDPLAVRTATRPDQLAGALFVPDVSLGRLVETPPEMSKVIATFISQDGLLDLDLITGPNAHKVMVTGYDFLTDMSKKIRTSWKNALSVATPDNSLTPVDGSLIGGNWNLGSVSARKSELRTHLSGNGGARYGVSALGGHASHFEEGVPGTSPFDIQGLDVRDLYGPDTCGTPGQNAIDLSGGVVYSVGCHGGLPVPGTCAAASGASARSLDLPQTMLSRGVVAYVANSGYAWGLKHGIGYGERLMELLTEEMTRGGTVITGDAVRRTKVRYFLETPRYDGYDEKTLMQWTFFGLPMYAIKSTVAGAVAAPPPFSAPAPSADARRGTTVQGGVRISVDQAQTVVASPPPPPYLTRAEVNFDFSAAGLYRKWNSAGDDVSAGPSGCPDPNGCYYTLNNLVERSTGASDLPVQPYFIYDSRLSGTSQHGVLWKGGVYDQESNWVPIFAELQSNGGDGSNHGVLPREIILQPVAPRIVPGGENEDCRPTDLELNSTVVGAGEAVKNETSGLYSTERRYRSINLEFFYFNDTRSTQPSFKPNCDRQGPSIGAGPFAGNYHQVLGSTITWSIPVTDIEADGSDVWRVLVVVNDNTVDGQGRGRWVPVELERVANSTTWTATESSFPPGASLTYVVQAVDLRGNVSWIQYEAVPAPDPARIAGIAAGDLPASGVPYGIPLPIPVTLELPSLSIDDVTVTEGDAGALNATFTVTLSESSPDTVTVSAVAAANSATSGADFTATGPLTLTFAPGVTTQTFAVPVLGDLLSEGTETFFVNLSSPTNATIGDGQGTGMIADNEPGPPARVFVSPTGSDAGDCANQNTPCRNLAGAITQVAIDGEVIVLSSGAYDTAPILITKGLKISSPAGAVVFITQPITINAPGGRVALRGLTIEGTGTGNGITLTAAAGVSIEDTTIGRWTNGLQIGNAVAAQISIANSVFRANTAGIRDSGGAVGNRIAVEDSRFERNTRGIEVLAGAFMIRESGFIGNTSRGVVVGPGSATIHRSEFSQNATAVATLSGGTVRLSRSRVFGNTQGLSAAAGGTFQSTGKNVVRGNTTDASGTIALIPEQ